MLLSLSALFHMHTWENPQLSVRNPALPLIVSTLALPMGAATLLATPSINTFKDPPKLFLAQTTTQSVTALVLPALRVVPPYITTPLLPALCPCAQLLLFESAKIRFLVGLVPMYLVIEQIVKIVGILFDGQTILALVDDPRKYGIDAIAPLPALVSLKIPVAPPFPVLMLLRFEFIKLVKDNFEFPLVENESAVYHP